MLFSAALNAQEIKVDAVLDTAKMRIGEQVKVDIYLSYTANKNISVLWPSIADTLTEKIEVISVSPIDTTFPDKTNSTKLLQHQQVTISVYDSGYYAIPGFKFVVNKDTANPLYTRPLFLEVHTVPTDSSATKTKDIKPPLEEPFNWKWYLNYIYWGGGLLAVILITILITMYYARKRRNVVIEPEKPKIPAHITALAALERIREEAVWKEGQVKEYYSAISDAVRLYIEERYGVNALESTTDEIMTAFRSQVIDRDSKEKLQQLLTLSDLVKFAKQFPIETEHLLTLQNAFDFVNGTKREEEMRLDYTANPQNSGLPGADKHSAVTQVANTTEKKQDSPAGKQPVQVNRDNTVKSKGSRLLVVLGVLIAIILSIVLIYFVTTNFLAGASKTDALAAPVADETREPGAGAKQPVMVDEVTRLDSVAAINEKTTGYYFTLLNVLDGQFDREQLKGQMRGNIISDVRTNPQYKEVRDKGGSIIYDYRDRIGRPLFNISVTPEDYLN